MITMVVYMLVTDVCDWCILDGKVVGFFKRCDSGGRLVKVKLRVSNIGQLDILTMTVKALTYMLRTPTIEILLIDQYAVSILTGRVLGIVQCCTKALLDSVGR